MSKIRGVGENKKGYNSFSGVDIKAVFGDQVIGELQAISYSVSREKAPLYTMGSADCRSYSRGKRGIAGTLIFLMFDRHAFLGHFGSTATSTRQGELGQYKPFLDANESPVADSAGFTEESAVSSIEAVPSIAATPETAPTNLKTIAKPQVAFFSDQVLPFDVTLAAANEYGALAVMRIYGCEILNEGYGVSIDDIVSEQQMSYVARTLMPWTSVQRTPV
jgi:hypothetical protein